MTAELDFESMSVCINHKQAKYVNLLRQNALECLRRQRTDPKVDDTVLAHHLKIRCYAAASEKPFVGVCFCFAFVNRFSSFLLNPLVGFVCTKIFFVVV